jgi:hypothetical protein
MAYTPESPNWTPVTNTEAHQITGSTYSPGISYSYPVSALPAPLQKLPGLKEAFISGYCETYKDVKDVEVQGEIIAARHDGTGKAYAYFFGVSASSVYFAGPYKQFDDHYYATSRAVPVERIFGASPKPNEKTE